MALAWTPERGRVVSHPASNELQTLEEQLAQLQRWINETPDLSCILPERLHDLTSSLHRLRESEQQYRVLFETMVQGVIYQNADGEIISANPAAERILGLTLDQMQGRTSRDPRWRAIREDGSDFPGEFHPSMIALRTGEAVHGIIQGIFNPSLATHRWILVNSIPQFRDGESKPYQVFTTLEDITERKEAADARRASEARFRALIENSSDAIALLDVEGIIRYVSPSSSVVLGYSPDELIGQPVLKYVHPDDLTYTIGQALEVMQNPSKIVIFQHRLRHKDGSWRWIEAHDRNLLDESEIGSIVVNFRDITDRLRRERELEAMVGVSAALRAAKSRAQLLEIILDHLTDLTGAHACSMVRIDEVTNELEVELARGKWADLTGMRCPPDVSSLSATIIQSQQPYLNNQMVQERPDSSSGVEWVGEMHAVLCIPLIAEARAIGALWIARTVPYTQPEVHLVTAVAEIAASAIHRQTLHQQMERHVRQLTVLRSIDLAITNSLDLRVTLDLVLNYILTQMGVDAAAVQILEPQSLTLRYIKGQGFRSNQIKQSVIRLGQGLAGQAALEGQTLIVSDVQAFREGTSRTFLYSDEGFVAYHGVPLVAKGQTQGLLELFHRTPPNKDDAWLEFIETLAGQTAIAIDNSTLFNTLQRTNLQLAIAYDATIEGWSRALDLRDKETEGHSMRVTDLTVRLAREMGLSEDEIIHIRRGALLHDIGKMGIPDSVLLKPGPLSSEEWKIMARHPTYGYEMLAPITFLRPALDIPYAHHEKWDGTGYPRGLKGEAIPFAARIFAIVDVWDALTSDRPYRAAWSEERAMAYIQEQAGSHFDAHVVEVFLKILEQDAHE